MRRTVTFWMISFLITLAAAYYQRITGPTYPLKGTAVLNEQAITYNLLRSHGGEGDARIEVTVPDTEVAGVLEWKRYKTDDAWTMVRMVRTGAGLTADLPHQPSAGKLAYRVALSVGSGSVTIPEREPVVIRFKGDVPLAVLIPHVIIMFLAMLFSTRTGIECFNRQPDFRNLTLWTVALMALGGMILGPVVQKYAFGEYWTGIPFGTDLTDNKTLIAFVAWLVAFAAVFKSRKPAPWIACAAVITLVIFLIPHSLFGSELEYSSMPK